MAAVTTSPAPAPPADVPRPRRRFRVNAAYLLLLPGAIWLGLFFVVPFYSLIATSLYDPRRAACSAATT